MWFPCRLSYHPIFPIDTLPDPLDAQVRIQEIPAREVAVVPQQFNAPFAYKVEEIVMLGRTPFMKPWRDFSLNDGDVVARTMDTVGIRHLAGYPSVAEVYNPVHRPDCDDQKG
jgi:ABC-type hemin transport system ATPase subunit